MKELKLYMLFAISILFVFSACEKHDPIDDLALIGKQAANSYWEIPNLSAQAGDSVSFQAQYWSVDNTIMYLGVWYDIVNNYECSATNSAFSYTLETVVTETGREFQEVINLSDKHNQNLWIDSLRAYVLDAKFPISHTLTSTKILDPIDFEEASASIKLFPATFETEFKEGLYPKLLVVADSSKVMKLLTVDFPRTDTLSVRAFYETKFDENAGTDVTVMAESAKELIKDYLNTIPLDSLVYNPTKLVYGIEYNKNFKLSARFRVVNSNGVENFSDKKEITVD